MALYLVGDLQGCHDELEQLLEAVRFDTAADQLWLAGDLVARGPQSLECLRLVYSLGDCARTVLGNHDLHLLAIHEGLEQPKRAEQLEAILEAPDRAQLMGWLRQQPLLLRDAERKLVLSHAGLPPHWSLADAEREAQATADALKGPGYLELLRQMYGNSPNYWDEKHRGYDRHRFTINALTRMRYCFDDGSLDFACKLPPEQAPHQLSPWFALPHKDWEQHQVVFGHWAALMGQADNQQVHALDTGCVWGNHLTLLRWDNKQRFIQPALNR